MCTSTLNQSDEGTEPTKAAAPVGTRRAMGDVGATLVEYAMLLALIAVVCIGAVNMFAGAASDKLTDAGNGIGGAGVTTTVGGSTTSTSTPPTTVATTTTTIKCTKAMKKKGLC